MRLHPLNTDLKLPPRFTYPFCYEPHPLSLLAVDEVKRELQSMALSEGKMFGVLVASAPDGTLGFLAAYSGLLEGRNDWPYFVPPVFDAMQPDGHFKQTEQQIKDAPEHRQLSQELQQWLFGQYCFLNARGETKDLVHVWQDYHCSPRIRRKYPLPPGGTGDCCAPKLLQYAYQQRLKPVCMAEFWWGPSPRTEIRQHGHFYPACRGKCKPVLTWMLQGLDVDPNPEEQGLPRLSIEVVYEDEWMLVVNKPSGLLSVPGRIEKYSVATILHERYPDSILAHRLDMGTSGLMVAAKNRSVCAQLQRQFTDRAICKRYVALLDGEFCTQGSSGMFTHGRGLSCHSSLKGSINLPLLCDPMNRPRQVVDYERGKPAITDYEVLGTENGCTRVALVPHTGRTHQLRMHCAHPDGLGCPIKGDELYGTPADRLYLHAERLELTHPVTGERMCFEQPAGF